jgi:hypothetical protein
MDSHRRAGSQPHVQWAFWNDTNSHPFPTSLVRPVLPAQPKLSIKIKVAVRVLVIRKSTNPAQFWGICLSALGKETQHEIRGDTFRSGTL